MSYNIQHLNTAGRATIFTIIVGVFTFAVAFMLNLGASEFNQAVAQQGDTAATTSVTVVNLPPVILVDGFEDPESSTSTPTNSGDDVTFKIRASDSNGESYWLIVCSVNATPTPNATNGPSCAGGGYQWGKSALTVTGATATAATTTTETTLTGGFFEEENKWYAYVCDNNSLDPKCTGPQHVPAYDPVNQPATATPFYVNNPPQFTGIWNDGPADPGSSVTHYSTTTDPDQGTTTADVDQVRLHICATPGFDYTNLHCTGVQLATTTTYVSLNASATDPIQIPTQDTTYNAYPYVVDQHGHAATSSLQGALTTFDVNNVPPDMSQVTANMSINGGLDMDITQEAAETTGFTLDFLTYDANSCSTTLNTREVVNFELSLYRSSSTDAGNNSSTTCRVNTAGDYDPNDCYTTAAGTTTAWTLSCTASTTACGGATDPTDAFSCTFPLWYVADPTDGGKFVNSDWRVQIAGVDDDFATGTPAEGDSPVDVNSLLAFDLNTFAIPYGQLAPGEDTDDNWPGGLGVGGNQASSTVQATGNVGIDQELEGSSMCPDDVFTGTTTPCNNSATSTIPAYNQVYTATSTWDYATASGTTATYHLSSTTPKELEINLNKSISTSTPTSTPTYWGILIPSSITRSGDYVGLNTFYALTAEIEDW